MRRPVSACSASSASRFQGLMTSGFSQIASAPYPQREPDMRIVEVVRRTDRHVVDAARLRPAAQLFQVAVEPLDLAKESDVERVAVENADGIIRIGGRNDHVLRVGSLPDAAEQRIRRRRSMQNSATLQVYVIESRLKQATRLAHIQRRLHVGNAG